MAFIYLPNQAKLNILRAQLETSSTLAGAKVHLYQSGIIITPITTLAELEAVQAVFVGYTPKMLDNWSSPVIVDGQAITEPDAVKWEATSPSLAMLHGCYLTNGAGDKLLGVAPFSSPASVPFNTELSVSLQWRDDSIFSL